MKFIRFGGLSPVKQKGYVSNEDDMCFHTPPARKGIYAFHYKFVDSFLLGGAFDNDNAKGSAQYIKNEKGEPYYEIVNKNYDVIETNYTKEIYDFLTESSSYYPNSDEKKERNFMKYYSTKSIQLPDGNKKILLTKPTERKVFEYTGYIWHHLDKYVNPKDIIDKKGSWVKTTCDVYEKCVIKETMHNKLKSGDGNINDARKNGYYAKDNLEVFIERIK